VWGALNDASGREQAPACFSPHHTFLFNLLMVLVFTKLPSNFGKSSPKDRFNLANR
jgi:hypothetical protein